MKKALYIDCCIRGNESNTKKLADAFLANLKDYEIKHLELVKENLKPLVGDFFNERQELLEKNERNHPRFNYAHEFKEADLIIIAAPFWDLSFPALLKIYIENISVDGITFGSTKDGLVGLCKADKMIYLTTRGGIYKDDPMEQASPYLKSLCKFFGIKEYQMIAADGVNIQELDQKEILDKAIKESIELAKTI